MTMCVRLLKLISIFIVVFGIYYVLNYFRLAYSKPRVVDYINGVEIGTDHQPFKRQIIPFVPAKTILNNYPYLGVNDDLPYMGTHHINPIQWMRGFDPEHPAGYMTWQGHVVGYIYSATQAQAEKYPYHWHKHKGICVMEGLVPTTQYSVLGCLIRGYFYMPQDKYMLHYWLVPNPDGPNDLYDPLLK